MYKPKNKKPVQLVKDLKNVPLSKQRWDNHVMEVKYDGVYAYGICNPKIDNNGSIWSRTGNQYVSLEHLEVCLIQHSKAVSPVVLIFEVYHDDLPVNIISGNTRNTRDQFTEAYGKLHDVIPYDHFVHGSSELPYSQRRAALDAHCTVSSPLSDLFDTIPSHAVRNEEWAKMYASQIIDEGGEGIVIKDLSGPWIAGKKHERMTKIKQELSYDLEVVGVLEGKGKYTGTLGKLQVRFKAFGKPDGYEIILPVSGMTDLQRTKWWDHPSAIVGKIVKVDAMTYSAHGSLREPRFKEVRADKIKADL